MSKHHIQPEYVENEHADAGRDGQTRLARPNHQVGNIIFPRSADHEQDCWQPYPVDPYSTRRLK